MSKPEVKIFDLDRFAKFKNPASDAGAVKMLSPNAIASISEIVGNNNGVWSVVTGGKVVEFSYSVPWGEFEAELNRAFEVIAEHQARAIVEKAVHEHDLHSLLEGDESDEPVFIGVDTVLKESN